MQTDKMFAGSLIMKLPLNQKRDKTVKEEKHCKWNGPILPPTYPSCVTLIVWFLGPFLHAPALVRAVSLNGKLSINVYCQKHLDSWNFSGKKGVRELYGRVFHK